MIELLLVIRLIYSFKNILDTFLRSGVYITFFRHPSLVGLHYTILLNYLLLYNVIPHLLPFNGGHLGFTDSTQNGTVFTIDGDITFSKSIRYRYNIDIYVNK
jgi:hypothetical protein